MSDQSNTSHENSVAAPHPGSQKMPRWNVGELSDAPVFTWKNWAAMLGPGLVMGGAAIGGGEWLMGPAVTARYGGALMWLATLSIFGQCIYNIEISRYALYSGEPIFSGKFRTLPGPFFWLFVYLALDFGSLFPYLASSAATPVAAVWLGKIPDSSNPEHTQLLRLLAYGIFLLCFLPLIFGGKIFNSLKAIMSFKIVVVLGFLTILGVFYSSGSTWSEIFSGFVKFGNVPVHRAEDENRNGILDPDEFDWDKDNRADVIEQKFKLTIDADGDGKNDAFDINHDGQPDRFVKIREDENGGIYWPDLNGDGEAEQTVSMFNPLTEEVEVEDLGNERFTGRGLPGFRLIDSNADKKPDIAFIDHDLDGTWDGDNIENVFVSLIKGKGMPDVDLSMIAFLGAFAAIAGAGGLSNTPISNYTRDQGWGMGQHVGAIPSAVGGHDLQLSHMGTVFVPNSKSLPRWKRWYRHVQRDQLVVWMPACFLGMALPSMLSVQFLKRGTVADSWTAAGMTADGVREAVEATSGSSVGHLFWFMTLFCGFLVLTPSMATAIDGFVRRWVDVFWTASPKLREWDPKQIKKLYFSVLMAYMCFGLIMLSVAKPLQLIVISANIMNFALGFSCWHTLVINCILLPRQLQPGWFSRICLFLAGLFFWTLATISALNSLGFF